MKELETFSRTLMIALAGIALYVLAQQVHWLPPLGSQSIYFDSVEVAKKR